MESSNGPKTTGPHKTLEIFSEQIMRRWEQLVRDCVRPAKNAPQSFIRDHIPRFLEELVEALEPGRNKESACEDNEIAAHHGKQRKAAAVYRSEHIVLEYYLLKVAITDVLCAHQSLSCHDYAAITQSIEDAISESLEAFSKTGT